MNVPHLLRISGRLAKVHLHASMNYRPLQKKFLLCASTSNVNIEWMQSSAVKRYSSSAKYNQYSSCFFAGACFASSLIAVWYMKKNGLLAEEQKDAASVEVFGLPVYTADEVAAHSSVEKRVWVCYKSGVYDITDFIPKHPGGDKILMAAGASLEPFWELFAVHKSEQVLKMLEEYRIGNLRVEDRGQDIKNMEDPFATDPRRHPILKPRSTKPFNAEPPMELLVENFLTPNEIFFVRNHLPVPEVNSEEYELEVSGEGIETVNLKLEDIKKKFKKHTITSTIQCAGNRRSELNNVKEVKGLNWGSAAISNAEWSGALLYDVLKYCGVNFNDPDIQHVQFEGLDTDPANMPYGASIPAEKALDPKSDVLLAYEMNGKELPRDHGYPIRVVAPGIVGARNVKWLGKIIVSEEESNSHWQQNDYKGFSPSTNWDNVDFKTAPAIQELPVNSAICKPSDGSSVMLQNGLIKVEGYAWSGGGRKIVRVDVSADGGKTWHVADLQQDSSPLYKCWAWTLWRVSVPVEMSSNSEVQIICKAVDSSYNVQPDSFPPIWNLRGVLGNAWHKINVKVQK
ncbi:sulfite oxidase-like isoform X2 [Stegodyphus dumicola]|uniref:sulfite oxidase-like isoform X2 n=1 Tax=Stegodyphus dumicola TaxID=202533 RepID=UPI0015B0A71C|nr:sulfite oxidase-like isoform X2 [Stegodyphus dumicola]XP_035231746.1 sulfite oxidase-like isoform X2 [Stegodyphus dumicola]